MAREFTKIPTPHFDKKSNRWGIKVGYYEDGKYCRKQLWNEDEKTLITMAVKLREQEDAKDVNSEGMSVITWINYWMNTEKKRDLDPETWNNYNTQIRLNITPTLGNILLKNLTKKQIQNFIDAQYLPGARKDGKKDIGYSASYVKAMRKIINSSLAFAVEEKKIKTNPCIGVKIKSIPKTQVRILTTEEVTRLINSAKGDRLYPALLLDLSTGLRKGELLGLKWQNIDLEEGFVHVAQSLRRHSQKSEIPKGKISLKNDNSQRIIPIPQEVVATLKQHQINTKLLRDNAINNGSEWQDTDFVFCGTTGKSTALRDFDDMWYRWREKAGLKDVRFHDLRHNFASKLLDAGIDVNTVMSATGHKQIKTLIDTYGHIIDKNKSKILKVTSTLI